MPVDAEKWLQEQIDSGAIPDNGGSFHWTEEKLNEEDNTQ